MTERRGSDKAQPRFSSTVLNLKFMQQAAAKKKQVPLKAAEAARKPAASALDTAIRTFKGREVGYVKTDNDIDTTSFAADEATSDEIPRTRAQIEEEWTLPDAVVQSSLLLSQQHARAQGKTSRKRTRTSIVLEPGVMSQEDDQEDEPRVVKSRRTFGQVEAPKRHYSPEMQAETEGNDEVSSVRKKKGNGFKRY